MFRANKKKQQQQQRQKKPNVFNSEYFINNSAQQQQPQPSSATSVVTATTSVVALDSEITIEDPSSTSFRPPQKQDKDDPDKDDRVDANDDDGAEDNDDCASDSSESTIDYEDSKFGGHRNSLAIVKTGNPSNNSNNDNNNNNNNAFNQDTFHSHASSLNSSMSSQNTFASFNHNDSLRSSNNTFANSFAINDSLRSSTNTFANSISTNNNDSLRSYQKSQSEPSIPIRGVKFRGVQERRYRMTLGEHPETEGVPVQLSWEHEQSTTFDSVTQHEDQRSGLRVISERTRNQIALRRNSTNTILNILDKMKQIRIGRKKTKEQVERQGDNCNEDDDLDEDLDEEDYDDYDSDDYEEGDDDQEFAMGEQNQSEPAKPPQRVFRPFFRRNSADMIPQGTDNSPAKVQRRHSSQHQQAPKTMTANEVRNQMRSSNYAQHQQALQQQQQQGQQTSSKPAPPTPPQPSSSSTPASKQHFDEGSPAPSDGPPVLRHHRSPSDCPA